MASSRETLVAGHGWIALIPNPNVVTANSGCGRQLPSTFADRRSIFEPRRIRAMVGRMLHGIR